MDDVGDDEVVVDDSDPEDPRKQIVTALGSPPAGWLGCVGMMAKENDDLASRDKTKIPKFSALDLVWLSGLFTSVTHFSDS